MRGTRWGNLDLKTLVAWPERRAKHTCTRAFLAPQVPGGLHVVGLHTLRELHLRQVNLAKQLPQMCNDREDSL